MPQPLPDAMVATLKSDPTAALAAALILASSFPNLVSWAMRTLGGQDCVAKGEPKANGVKPPGLPVSRGNGVARRHGTKRAARANGHSAPRETAARHDQALLALMQANPDATVTEIIRMSGRPRNSATLSLERLEKGGLVEHQGRGKWTVVDPDLLEVPAPKPAGWVAPLSGNRKARHAADGRVRDELTMAATPH
jgi:Sugar-specific transcriptional regulator TrmB